MQHRCVLHYHNVKVREIVCLNFENSIDSCKNTCSLCVFQIFFIRNQILFQNWKFICLESFDNKSMVIWKEEKAATSSCLASCTFTCLKHLILIDFYFQRLQQSLWRYVILFLYLVKYFIIDTFYFKLNWNLQRILYLRFLTLYHSCLFFKFERIISLYWSYISKIFNLKIYISRRLPLKKFLI